MARIYANENNVSINIGSLLLKEKNKKKLVNRSIFINSKGKIIKRYDKIHYNKYSTACKCAES